MGQGMDRDKGEGILPSTTTTNSHLARLSVSQIGAIIIAAILSLHTNSTSP